MCLFHLRLHPPSSGANLQGAQTTWKASYRPIAFPKLGDLLFGYFHDSGTQVHTDLGFACEETGVTPPCGLRATVFGSGRVGDQMGPTS